MIPDDPFHSQMPVAVHEVLWQLFRNGPTWDGDLIDKQSRTWLMQQGLADKVEGYNFLTEPGVSMAVSLGMDRRKEKERLK